MFTREIHRQGRNWDSFFTFVGSILVINILACGSTTSVHYSPVQSSSAKSQNLPFTSLALVVKPDVPGSDEEVRLLDRFLSTEFIIRRKQLVESNGDVQVEAVIKQLEKVAKRAGSGGEA